MARFRCRVCREGMFEYKAGRHACPRCGSPDVQFAIAIAEMPDDLLDELIQMLSQAERLDDHPTDEDC